MKHFIFVVSLLFVTHAYAQNEKPMPRTAAKQQSKDTSYNWITSATAEAAAIAGKFVYVEQMPKSGYNIQEYLTQHMHYPDTAFKYKIEGRVTIKFVVEETGNISNVTVLKGFNKYCDDEAIRVVANMPPWVPGKKDGQPVKVYFTLPITFKLTD